MIEGSPGPWTVPKCSLASGGCASDRSAAIACVASAASRRKHSPGAKHFSSSSSPSSSPLGYLASCSYSPELSSHAVNGAPHGTPMSNNMYRVGGKNCIPKSRQRSTFSSSSSAVVVVECLSPTPFCQPTFMTTFRIIIIFSSAAPRCCFVGGACFD